MNGDKFYVIYYEDELLNSKSNRKIAYPTEGRAKQVISSEINKVISDENWKLPSFTYLSEKQKEDIKKRERPKYRIAIFEEQENKCTS